MSASSRDSRDLESPGKINQIELVANDSLSSLYAWHAFDIWKSPFVRKRYNILVFLKSGFH